MVVDPQNVNVGIALLIAVFLALILSLTKKGVNIKNPLNEVDEQEWQ